MRRFAVAAALSLALGVPTITFAHAGQAAPPATQKPTTPPPAAQTPPPATQKPATPAPAQPPKPFPQGAKIAYMDIQRVAAESSEGKAATSRVSALRDKKLAELQAKNKQLEAAQQKASQAMLSEDARGQASREGERLTVEIQRMQQDADAELQELQQQLQLEFQRKLTPVIQQVSQEKALELLLSRADAGIIWADQGLDLTEEIIKRFDAATAGAKPPAAPPKRP